MLNGNDVQAVAILAPTLITLVWIMRPKRLRAELSEDKVTVDIEGGKR